MRFEWIRSPAFWAAIPAPLSAIAAVAVSGDLPAPGMALAAVCGVVPAFAAGAWLAARERRLRGTGVGGGAVVNGVGTLSASQAANYRDLFENATDIVFTTDLSGHFLAGNKAVQRLLGYTVEEAKSLTWERLVAPYDMWKARQMYKRHAAGEQRISFELDTVTASGRIKTFEIGSRPMFHAGELSGFHGIARDVTSRKEIERQLDDARRDAEIANESKSTFLANMSHEIRTPINGILGFLSLFAKTELTPRQKELLVPVEESTRHLLKIINDVLDLSKIEAGRFSIDNEIFNFRDVVHSAVELLRPQGESKGLAVSVDFDPRIPRLVVADGTRLGQVVSNLVSNAIKFTDAGTVSIRAREKESGVEQVSVEIVVADTGIGIAPEHQAVLFEPFRQLDARPDRRYPGTGLGLTISRNLVEAMGGRIRVASEPGRYTEVAFEIPLALAPEQVAAATPGRRDTPRRFACAGLRALIVDDNDINRRYLQAVLEQLGLAAEQAPSGAAALAACRDQPFDMVFMDIHMADMDGIETTRRLRAQLPRYRAVPVVAVSADVMGHGGARFTEQGFDRFLPKPVKEADLAALLGELFPAHAGEDPDAGRPAPDGGGCVLDRQKGLALASSDEALWRRSVSAFRSQLLEVMPGLRSAVEAGDCAEAGRLAHKLAGPAAYVAAEEIAGRARRLQQAARGGAGAEIGRHFDAMNEAVERFFEVDPDAAT